MSSFCILRAVKYKVPNFALLSALLKEIYFASFPFLNLISINLTFMLSLSSVMQWITKILELHPFWHTNSFLISVFPSFIPSFFHTYFWHHFFDDIFMIAPEMYPILWTWTGFVHFVSNPNLGFTHHFSCFATSFLTLSCVWSSKKFMLFCYFFLSPLANKSIF